tara:strand:+ start:3609 stop:4292 length:684 start_codon:yes stop_codon:yes gene_type:complete
MLQNQINHKGTIFKYLCLLFLIFTSSLFSQNSEKVKKSLNKSFNGLYFGLNTGKQTIFSGAFINNIDVLAQDSKITTEFISGYRKQVFDNKIVFGGEIQIGLSDHNLMLDYIENSNSQFNIDYTNKNQISFGLNTGVVISNNTLLFAYGYIVKSNFDIVITEMNGSTFSQEDGQRFLRYGIGIEIPIYKSFNIKGTLGSTKIDHDDLQTNTKVDSEANFAFGVIYQF